MLKILIAFVSEKKIKLQKEKKMKTINFGVIGAAKRGALARLAHQPARGLILKAAADINDDSLKNFKDWAEKVGHKDYIVTKDYHQILQDSNIHAVFITAPDFLHEEMAVDALMAGKHVYLEKPMAITIEGCDRVLEAARKSGSKLFVGHNMRYMPFVLKMKEIIDNDVIGKVQAVWCRHFINYGGDAYFKDWHSERKNTTGLLLQKGAHDIDVIHWLAGGYSKKVTAMGRLSVYQDCGRREANEKGIATSWQNENWPPLSQNKLSPIIDVEDHNMMLMQLDNGVQCSYTQCHYTPDSSRNYTFIGTKGRLENIDNKSGTYINVKTTRNGDFSATPDIVYSLNDTNGGHGGADPKVVEGFLQYLLNNVTPNVSPIDARNSVAAGVCATQSLRGEMGMIDVPPVSKEIQAYFSKK